MLEPNTYRMRSLGPSELQCRPQESGISRRASLGDVVEFSEISYEVHSVVPITVQGMVQAGRSSG